jgi:glycerol-3-phosphate dehydrogenase
VTRLPVERWDCFFAPREERAVRDPGRHWLIGTTDRLASRQLHPAATAADIDYILEHVNAWYSR